MVHRLGRVVHQRLQPLLCSPTAAIYTPSVGVFSAQKTTAQPNARRVQSVFGFGAQAACGVSR